MKQRQARLVVLMITVAALASAWSRPAAACGEKCHFIAQSMEWECVFSVLNIDCVLDISGGCDTVPCTASSPRLASSSSMQGGDLGSNLGLACSSSRPTAVFTASAGLDAPFRVVRLKERT